MNTNETELPSIFTFKAAKSMVVLAIAGLFTHAGASAFGDSRAPLMAGLDDFGEAKPLDALGLNIYGYVEGGYFFDASVPDNGRGPTYIGFNSFKNTPILDKIDLTFERVVDQTKKQFDLGYHLEGLWGADAAFIHSNGMNDTQTGRNQWDLIQAYVDLNAPGIPLRIRVGKWIELAGFEQFSANIYGAFGDPSKAFYSYSYQFLYAEPGTQAGVLATYALNGQWSFDAGVTRGWNQSLEDGNRDPDFLGRITWTPSDKTSAIFVMTEGPEFPAGVGPNQTSGDNRDWWTALDLVVTRKATDNLSLGLGFDYVYAPRIPGVSGAQQWGGVAGYVSYAIDPHFALNTRLEWFGDRSGFGSGATGFGGINFYEATMGFAVKPLTKDATLSHLLIRPEIRYDNSDRPAFGRGDRGQLSVAVDALFTF